MYNRFPRELGRASRLHAKHGLTDCPYQNNPGQPGTCLHPVRHRKGGNAVVTEPRETEGKEKGEGSLSIFIVPLNGGKSAP